MITHLLRLSTTGMFASVNSQNTRVNIHVNNANTQIVLNEIGIYVLTEVLLIHALFHLEYEICRNSDVSTMRDVGKWKEGLFCFENESIQDLIKKLELYYDTTIEIQRPSFAV